MKYDTLPSVKKKQAFIGRVGVRAEKRKMASTITVSSPKRKKLTTIAEELDPFDDAIYDTPLEQEKVEVEEEEIISDEEIVITDVIPPSGKPKVRRKLVLSEEEIDTIVRGDMLTDESINRNSSSGLSSSNSSL